MGGAGGKSVAGGALRQRPAQILKGLVKGRFARFGRLKNIDRNTNLNFREATNNFFSTGMPQMLHGLYYI